MQKLVGIVLLVLTVGAVAEAGWLDGWQYRRQLEIDATQIAAELHDFPLLVRLSPAVLDFDQALPDGADIRFTAGDGVTLLDFERESFDSDQATGLYWVRVPFVSDVANTRLYLYYGNRQATDGTEPAAVWDDDHVAVWHLGESNGEWHHDSTAHGNDLKVYGEVEEGEVGAVGNGVALAGLESDPRYLITPDNYPEIEVNRGITYSAWACPTNYSRINGCIVSIGGGNWPSYWLIRFGYYSGDTLSCYAPGFGGDQPGRTTSGFNAGVWSHVAVTLDYDSELDSSRMRLFINGTLARELVTEENDVFARSNPIKARPIVVGAQTQSAWPGKDPEYYYNGWLDEVRVSSVSRSPAWIAASYASQASDSTMIRLGEVESHANWYGGWRRRMPLEIDHQQLAGDLTNFPLLVRLTRENFDFAAARADGHDIRFTADDGGSLLAYECEEYDSVAGRALYWVRLPLISSSSNTLFYLYYRQPMAGEGSTATEVWDAHHAAVWHLGESNGEWQHDATRNVNHLQNQGVVEEGEAGIIGAAVALGGTDYTDPRYLITPVSPVIDTSRGVTYSAWACPTNQPGSYVATIVGYGGGNWPGYQITRFGYRNANLLNCTSNSRSGTENRDNFGQIGPTAAGFMKDLWSHVAVTLEFDAANTNTTLHFYINGALVKSDSREGQAVDTRFSARPLVVGGQNQSSWPGSPAQYLYNGWLDEVRVSGIVRSEAWLNASYESQKPDSSVLTFGKVEPPGGSVMLVR